MMKLWEWLSKNWDVKYNVSTSSPPPLKNEDLETLGIKIPKVDFGKCYSEGSPELKEILSNLYSVPVRNIFIGSSASDINDTIFDTLISKGHTILVESPAYPPLLESPKRRAKLTGAKVKQFKRSFENGFKIGLDGLEKAINKKTSLIVLTNLNNPTGVKTDEDTIAKMGEIAKENNSIVMIDEVYRRYCKGLKSGCQLNDSIVITDSLSKFFGATSLRIGWAIGNEELIEKLEDVKGYRNVNNCTFSEDLTALLLPHQDFFEERIRKHYGKNFKLFEEWAKGREDIEVVMPDGNFCCFPKLKNIKDTSKFVDHLIKKYSTSFVPGEMYGLGGHIRICFGCSYETLENALENLGKALDSKNHKF